MTSFFRDNIEKMTGYTPGFQPSNPDAIKINTNENPYPPSPKVFEALANLSGNDLRRYPPILWDRFRETAARIHGIEPECIVCGNGGDEILAMLVRACCNKNRPMAYPTPTYTLYPILAEIQNCPVIEIPFALGYRLPKALFKTNAALTIVCNPNAPSGTVVATERLAELAKAVPGVLLIDEAYVDFAEENALPLLKDFDNVAILRSMSKGYSLAGMRFGYALTSVRIAEAMIKVKDSYNVNVAAQAAATAALADRDYFRTNIEKIKAERRRVTEELRNMGFELNESHTNFLLARPKMPPARQIHEKLAENNIFIRYFQNSEMADKLRISMGTPEQNDALLKCLRQIISVSNQENYA